MDKFIQPEAYISHLNHHLLPFRNINTGEKVTLRTMNAFGGKITTEEDFAKILQGIGRIINHPATGPIYINGVKKGEVIAVSIKCIKLIGNYFQCVSYSTGVIPGFQNKRNCKIYKNNDSIIIGKAKVKVKANLGYIATAWNKSISCGKAGAWGGNMDFVQLKEGCVVHLPVFHDGAFLALGDVHAAQGEGEISGTGAEADAFVTVTVKKSRFTVNYPVIETQKDMLVVGYGRNLKAAIKQAVINTLDFLYMQIKLKLEDEYLLLGLIGNITLGNSTGAVKTAAVKFHKNICSN